MTDDCDSFSDVEVKIGKLEVEIKALKELMESKMSATALALEKASIDLNNRLEVMNEFRAQINAERLGYMTKDQFDERHEALRAEFDTKLESIRAEIINLQKAYKTDSDFSSFIRKLFTATATGVAIAATILAILSYIHVI